MFEGQTSIEALVFRITRRFLTAFIGSIMLFLVIALGLAFFFYIDESTTVQGTIEPSAYSFIRPQISGRIKEVFVSGGEYVEKGKLLAEMDDVDQKTDFYKVTEDLEIAKNNLFNAEQELKLLRLNNANQIEQAQVSLKRAQIELENEVSINNLSKAVYSEISKELKLADPKQEPLELRRKKLTVEQAELSLKVAEDDKAKEVLKQIVVENLRIAVAKTERELEFTQDKIRKTRICAPTNGYVLTSDIEKLKGSFATEGQNLFRIGNFSNWIAKIYLAEQHLPRIKKGQRAKLYIKAYPYERYRVFNGKVEEVSLSPSSTNANNPIPKSQGMAMYPAVVSIQEPGVINSQERLTLYDGLVADVKIMIKKEKILSALKDKLFFTSAKLKNIPLHGSK